MTVELICKISSSVAVLKVNREPLFSRSQAELDKVVNDPYFKRWHSAQLNEVEYTGPFVAGLLFLNSKGVAAPVASGLALFGQVWYFWFRAFVGHVHEGGTSTPVPPYVPGAVARYFAWPLITMGIYKAL